MATGAVEERRKAAVEWFSQLLAPWWQSGEQLQGVAPVNLHTRLAAPPKKVVERQVVVGGTQSAPSGRTARSEGHSWLTPVFWVLGIMDLFSGVNPFNSSSQGSTWGQRGVWRGGWSSEAGKFRLAAWGFSSARANPLSPHLRFVVTDRRVLVFHAGTDWDTLPEQPEQLVAEFPRGMPDSLRTRQRRMGTRVDLVFGDGSWISLDPDIQSNEKYLSALLNDG
ncbi:hypothetical protein [Phaeacidiphilus oryzae]|uniref:hypothetical protein n=1 Tax=Phaeacidiphilus oryzae TaxID=348818 RepID=UPI00056BA890|nr:hypothetical protein [Phaeacidiphilus oryzae]